MVLPTIATPTIQVCNSVAVLADVLVMSSQKIIIFIIREKKVGKSIPLEIVFIF